MKINLLKRKLRKRVSVLSLMIREAEKLEIVKPESGPFNFKMLSLSHSQHFIFDAYMLTFHPENSD